MQDIFLACCVPVVEEEVLHMQKQIRNKSAAIARETRRAI